MSLAKKHEVEAIKKKLQKIYSQEECAKIIGNQSDDELLDWARKHQRGLHMATPVFDGAAEAQIRQLLVEAVLMRSDRVSSMTV